MFVYIAISQVYENIDKSNTLNFEVCDSKFEKNVIAHKKYSMEFSLKFQINLSMCIKMSWSSHSTEILQYNHPSLPQF